MAVKRIIPDLSGTYFITFTCYKWISLIELTDSYDVIYKWFDHLKQKGHFVNAFVVMPNHVHCIITFVNTGQNINTIVGNGKRFMAYEIVSKIKTANNTELLALLGSEIEDNRKAKGKLHNVWELSFDWKECAGENFTNQKLDYIHNNPCIGRWLLADSPANYRHSSAS